MSEKADGMKLTKEEKNELKEAWSDIPDDLSILNETVERLIVSRIEAERRRIMDRLPPRLIPDYPFAEGTEKHFKLGFNICLNEIKAVIKP